jgi:hypothetical protein
MNREQVEANGHEPERERGPGTFAAKGHIGRRVEGEGRIRSGVETKNGWPHFIGLWRGGRVGRHTGVYRS